MVLKRNSFTVAIPRSNLTGAGNAKILSGRGADGAVRDGRFTDAEGVCVERLDAVYEQPQRGST